MVGKIACKSPISTETLPSPQHHPYIQRSESPSFTTPAVAKISLDKPKQLTSKALKNRESNYCAELRLSEIDMRTNKHCMLI